MTRLESGYTLREWYELNHAERALKVALRRAKLTQGAFEHEAMKTKRK